MTKAVIFDFDGVIVLSERAKFKVLQKLFNKYGLKIYDADFKKMVGRITKQFLEIVGKDLNNNIKAKIIQEYEKIYKDNILKHVKPIKATIDFIRNYKGDLVLALATGSDFKIIENTLKEFGIFDKFKVLVTKNDVAHTKPHPETYLKTINKLNMKPEECIVIEDSIAGVESAISAKASVYVFLNGIYTKNEFKNLKINGFLETKDDFNKLFKLRYPY